MNQGLIVLASASPRRRELLDQIGLCYLVRPVKIDESRMTGESPAELAVRLSVDKARAAASDGAAVVLAADTVVAIDDDVLGKPRNRADGMAMLRRLSGRMHRVYTGVACLASHQERTALSVSRVSFRTLSERECSAYWDTGEPHGKAGAYAIQGRAAAFVCRLEGSYSGVVGLPLFETAELLRERGIDVPGPLGSDR
ncbi:MAG: Maf family protein [Gammaproteobacteria bacterium]